MVSSIKEDATRLSSSIVGVLAQASTFQERMMGEYEDKNISFVEYSDTLRIYPRLRDALNSVRWVITAEDIKIARATKRNSREAEEYQGED